MAHHSVRNNNDLKGLFGSGVSLNQGDSLNIAIPGVSIHATVMEVDWGRGSRAAVVELDNGNTIQHDSDGAVIIFNKMNASGDYIYFVK